MSNFSTIRHTLKQMYPNKSSLIARVPLNLNADITNIIKDMILRSDSHYTYNAFKKKLGELIIEFYSKIVKLFDKNRPYIEYLDYSASKFHPEKGDFKTIYDIIVEVFKNYKNPNFNVKKVTFGKTRKYFIIKLISKNLEKSSLYLVVNYSYVLKNNYNDESIFTSKKEYIYKFNLKTYKTIDEAKEEIKLFPIKLSDVSDIIENILVKINSQYSYNDFKNKLGELIIKFYNMINNIFYFNEVSFNTYINYDGSKFDPEKGDFKEIYDIIVALFKNYKNHKFNVRKILFNNRRPYFIIQLISNNTENIDLYVFVTYKYDLRTNLYEFKFKFQPTIDEIKEIVNIWFRNPNITTSLTPNNKSLSSIKSLSSKLSSNKSFSTKSSLR